MLLFRRELPLLIHCCICFACYHSCYMSRLTGICGEDFYNLLGDFIMRIE